MLSSFSCQFVTYHHGGPGMARVAGLTVNYVEPALDISDSDSALTHATQAGAPTGRSIPDMIQEDEGPIKLIVQFEAKALFDYVACNEDELTFLTGDIMEVLDSEDPDWFEVRLGEKIGMVPANYLEKL
jgi:hypothetical protein